MKKLLLFILITSSIHFFAQQTYVPDDNFEQALIDLGHDDVLDDYVLTVNINGVTFLDVNYKAISDLTGIEDFTTLEYLYCHFNQLSTLDISQNPALIELVCSQNQLSAIDISQNTVLTELRCYYNQLTTLDVSQNTALTVLLCEDNQLTTLDVRNGNNGNIPDSYFNTTGNPSLSCIFVDDAAWSTANWTHIDPASTFVETQAECDALGIDDEFLLQNVQIYPNPITDQLFINGNHINILSIQLYNVLGKKVLHEQSNLQQIDVSNLNQGVYLVKIKTDKGIISKKIIKS